MVEFFQRLGRMGTSEEQVKKLLGSDALMERWVRQLVEQPELRLRHGRFHSMQDKLTQALNWPGHPFTEEHFVMAMEEATTSGRLARFEAEADKNPLLNVVVSIYLATAHQTFAYARDRMRDTFGPDRFSQWAQAYADITAERLALAKDVVGYRDCVRIEVIDLGAHWNTKQGFVPNEVRGKDSAHAAVLYSAAEDPDWVRQMDGKTVPYVMAGGYDLTVPGYG